MIQVNDITLTTYRHLRDDGPWEEENDEHKRIWFSTENHGSKVAIHTCLDEIETTFTVDREELMVVLRILGIIEAGK